MRSRWIAASVVVGVGVALGASMGLGDGPPAPAAPVVTEVAAPAPAPSSPIVFDSASAVVESRDAYSTTSVDANGVHEVALSPVVVNVQVDGVWVPASAALTDDGAAGLEALQHPLTPSLAPAADDPALVSVSNDGYTVSFALKGAAGVPLEHVADAELPASEADHAMYADVFPSTDLEYSVSPSDLKESVVLKEAPVTDDVEFTWRVLAPGLVATQNDFGDLEFRDPQGAVVFSMPMPLMWDSSGVEGERGRAEANIPYELAEVAGDAYDVTLRPDTAWLRDSARVYPVFVDPSVTPGYYSIREFKSDGIVSAGSAQVGNVHSSSTCCNWRTVASYDLASTSPSMLTKQIIGASLSSSTVGGTANCYPGNVYTAYSWSYGNAGIWTYLSYFANCAAGGADEDIYKLLAISLRDGQSKPALMFTGYEYPVWSYKVLSTTLYVYYVSPPEVTGVKASTPQNGAKAVAFPVMEPEGKIYAGSNQYFQYVFTSDDGGDAWTSPWTLGGPYRVPDGALSAGKHYKYRIKTKDDFVGSPEPLTDILAHPEWNFTMDAAPNSPTDVTVNAQALTADVTSGVARPEVCAKVSDPDDGDVQAYFTIRQGDVNGIVVVDSLAGEKVNLAAGATGTSCATLPYAIARDSKYTIEVKSFDGALVSDALIPGHNFTGPPNDQREIPTSSDSQTGAQS